MNPSTRIVIATPHQRYDALERCLRDNLALEVFRIRSREELALEALRNLDPDYVFFPHWSWKIPSGIMEQFECVVFHMTDLPFGRGGSPLQNLVMRGIESTQLSALRCEDEIDAGPIYLKRSLSTLGTAEEVFLRAALLMEEMIMEIVTERPQPAPQSGAPTGFERRRPEQGSLEQARTLSEVHDLIRMLDAEEYPHAFLETENLRLTFTRSSLRPGHVTADVRIEIRRNGDDE